MAPEVFIGVTVGSGQLNGIQWRPRVVDRHRDVAVIDDRLVKAITSTADLPGNDALHKILAAVLEHEGTKVAHDDKTLVLADYVD